MVKLCYITKNKTLYTIPFNIKTCVLNNRKILYKLSNTPLRFCEIYPDTYQTTHKLILQYNIQTNEYIYIVMSFNDDVFFKNIENIYDDLITPPNEVIKIIKNIKLYTIKNKLNIHKYYLQKNKNLELMEVIT